MARLKVKWERVTPTKASEGTNGDAQTGEQEKGEKGEKGGKKGQAKTDTPGKPWLVFVSTTDRKKKQLVANIERGVLKNERVALALHFFRCIKLNGDFMDSAHPLARFIKGKKLPRIVLISPDKTKIKVFEVKASASKLYKSLCKISDAFNKKTKLAKYVAGMSKVLLAMDKLDQLEKKISRAKKKGKVKSSDLAKLAKMRKAIKAAEAKLTKRKFKVEKGKADDKGG